MGAVHSKKDVSLKVDSVGVINVFPDPPHNSSPPAVINNNQTCRCNNNITKKEITFPSPSPPPPPSPPTPPTPTPESLRRCNNNNNNITKKEITFPSPSPSPPPPPTPPTPPPESLRRCDDDEDFIPKKNKETEGNDICAPGFFSDFGKQANDLLTKDYYNKDMNKSFFSIKTHSNAGVDLTLTALKKKKNMHTRSNGLTIGDLTASYKSKTNKNNSIQFKIDAAAPTSDEADKSNNGFLTTTQFQYEVVPDFMNVFMSMEYPDMSRGSRSKIGCQCFIPEAHLNFTAASTFNELPILEGSATIGTHDLAIGGDVVGDTKKSEFKYRGGIRHVNSMFDMSAVVSDDTTMKVSCVHPLNLKNTSYGVAEFKKRFSTNEDPMTLTVGTLFEVNHPWKEERKTVVKAKLDNHGKVGVVLQQQLIDDKVLQICSEFDTMAFNNTPRIGVSLCSLES